MTTSTAANHVVDAKMFNKLTDDLFTKVNVLQRQSYLLMHMLEEMLDENRGQVTGETVSLKFQKRTIDVAGWLVGQVWSESDDVVELVDKLIDGVTSGDTIPTMPAPAAPIRMTGGARS